MDKREKFVLETRRRGPLITLSDYRDLPARAKFKASEISVTEDISKPWTLIVEITLQRYSRCRKRRQERTEKRISDYINDNKPMGLVVVVKFKKPKGAI